MTGILHGKGICQLMQVICLGAKASYLSFSDVLVNGATVLCASMELQYRAVLVNYKCCVRTYYIYIINIILYITRMLQEHLTRPLLPVVQRVVWFQKRCPISFSSRPYESNGNISNISNTDDLSGNIAAKRHIISGLKLFKSFDHQFEIIWEQHDTVGPTAVGSRAWEINGNN